MLLRCRGAWGNYSASAIEGFCRAGILAPGAPLEIWNVDGASVLVTETVEDFVFVWAYQGRDAVLMLRDLVNIARKNGLRAVRYRTERKGFSRMLREFSPIRLDEFVYEIKVN